MMRKVRFLAIEKPQTLLVAVMIPLCVLFLFLFTSLNLPGSSDGLLLLTNLNVTFFAKAIP